MILSFRPAARVGGQVWPAVEVINGLTSKNDCEMERLKTPLTEGLGFWNRSVRERETSNPGAIDQPLKIRARDGGKAATGLWSALEEFRGLPRSSMI